MIFQCGARGEIVLTHAVDYVQHWTTSKQLIIYFNLDYLHSRDHILSDDRVSLPMIETIDEA